MSVPTKIHKAVGLARAAGVLETVCWCPGSVLLARIHGDSEARTHEATVLPTVLAGAIARVDPASPPNGGAITWRHLLDAMEDLAEVWPWWTVTP